MSQLKVGNTVWLKIGSPKMIISETKDDICTCEWFDNKKPQTKKYHQDLLTTKDPNELATGFRL